MVFIGLLLIFSLNTLGGILALFFKNQKLLDNLFDFSLGLMLACSISSMLMKAFNYQNNIIILISIFISLFILIIILYFQNSGYFIALMLHNIPEGLVVSLSFLINPLFEAFMFSFAIGIQNIPEGFSVAINYKKEGNKKALLMNILSGIVEPIFGLLGILLNTYILPYIPYAYAVCGFLMIFVVIFELKEGLHSYLFFMFGFFLMLILDLMF